MPLKIDRYVINVFPFKKKCAKKIFQSLVVVVNSSWVYAGENRIDRTVPIRASR